MSRRKTPFITQLEEYASTAPLGELTLAADLFAGIVRRRRAAAQSPAPRAAKLKANGRVQETLIAVERNEAIAAASTPHHGA